MLFNLLFLDYYWKILDFYDCGGNDMSRHKTTNINECISICEAILNCIGAVYVDAWLGGENCFPKPTGKCNPYPNANSIGIHTAIKSKYNMTFWGGGYYDYLDRERNCDRIIVYINA